MAYYTGLFAQALKPHEVYTDLIGSLETHQQSEQEIFSFLKAMTGNNKIDTEFIIPLQLLPIFDCTVTSYIYHTNVEFIDLYLSDCVLAIDDKIINSDKGKYRIKIKEQSAILKIKHDNTVYTIVVIKELI